MRRNGKKAADEGEGPGFNYPSSVAILERAEQLGRVRDADRKLFLAHCRDEEGLQERLRQVPAPIRRRSVIDSLEKVIENIRKELGKEAIA